MANHRHERERLMRLRMMADAQRRLDHHNEAEEILADRRPSNAMPIDYLPEHMRLHKASESRWNVALTPQRMYGAASESKVFAPESYAYVKVTRNGQTESHPARDFRGHGRTTGKTQSTQNGWTYDQRVRLLHADGDSNH
jgi:hypothetical protein